MMNRMRLILWLVVSGLCLQPSIWAQTKSGATAKTPPQVESAESRSQRIFALRLRPGQDLRQELIRFTAERSIRAGFIYTAVGSLRKAVIRCADQEKGTAWNEKLELVSLVGTLSTEGSHLHLSVSDKNGKTFGGHLLDGCVVYTTVELVIGDLDDLTFVRENDPDSGYQELKIKDRRSKFN